MSENNTDEAYDLLIKLLQNEPAKLRKLKDKLGGGVKPGDVYYSKQSGLAIKKIADGMLLDGMDREILFEDLPQWRPNTIRQRIFSGIRFLVMEMDDEQNTYAKWKRATNTHELKDEKTNTRIGIQFRFVKNKKVDEDFELFPRIISQMPTASVVDWKAKVLVVLNDGGHMDEKNLELTEDDKDWMMKQFVGKLEYVVKVSNNRVKVIYDPNKNIDVDPRLQIE